MSRGASLNHIFRTVWNQALGAMVAVAETDSSVGRSPSRRTRAHALHRPPEVGIGLLALSVAVAWSALAPSVHANPTGGVAIVGQATVVNNGNAMQVTTQNGVGTNFSAINWQSFSIPAGSSTHFQQPNAASTSINRVVTNTPSQLFGNLSSNGSLVLVNQFGIAVGKGAVVDTAGFTASSLAMSDQDAMAGRLRFGNGSISTADLMVNGSILARSGDVVLLGPNVQTAPEALIQAPNGSAILAAGHQIEITGRGLEGIRLQVQAPADSAVNLGSLQADAVGMFAGTLKHTGLIQATSVSESGGRVVLKAADVVTIAGQVNAQRLAGMGGEVLVSADKVLLQSSAVLDVSGLNGGGEVLVGGGWQGHDARVMNASQTVVATGAKIKADALLQGNGGTAVVWSDGATRFGGLVSARGGEQSGNGGKAEVSGKQFLDFRGTANLSAPKGQVGLLLLDPDTLIIGTVGDANGDGNPIDDVTGDFTAPTVGTGLGSQITATQVGFLLNGANLSLSANGDVTVASPVTKTSGAARTLSLTSNNGSILVNAAISGTSGSPLNLVANAYGNVNVGVGAPINTQGGTVSLTATVGTISQSAPITAANLSANSVGTITLSNASNSISSFSASTTAYGANVTLNNSGPLSLGNVSVTNAALNITTANGAITQAGSVVVGYGATINAGSGSINLPLGTNDFNTLAMTGGQIFVKDSNALALNAIAASGTLQIQSVGNLSLNANISSTAGGNAVSLITNGVFNGSGGVISTLGGRWLAYFSDSNLSHTYGSNSPAFKQYNASFGSAISGAGNGVLDATAPSLSGSLGGTVSKTYDGSTTISPSGATVVGLAGALGYDDVAAAIASPASANLVDPNVGVGKAVTVAGTVTGVVGGSSDFNFFNKPIYGYQFSASGNIGVVNLAPASVSLTGTRVYDGTSTVNADIFSIGGLAANETLTLSGAGFVADKNVGSNKPVSLGSLALGNGTGLASNYTFIGGTAVATITQAPISGITGIVASNKVYDGSTSATVSTSSASYVGKIGSDVLTVAGATGAFSDRNAGVGKFVSVTGLTLGGVDAGNYTLTNATSSAVADITPKTVGVSDFVAVSKVYDGTSAAVLTGGALSGVLAGDAVALAVPVGTFSDKNVGKSKAVTVSAVALSGADAGNYLLTPNSAVVVADITPRPLTVTGIQALNKIYDGKTDASVNLSSAVLQGAVAGDAVAIADVSATFVDKNVGTGKTVALTSTYSGADLANYAVVGQTTTKADISPKLLTLAPIVEDKTFDNSVAAKVTDFGLSGFVLGESVAAISTSATFDTINAAIDKRVSIAGISLVDGSGRASNYSVPSNATARATIFDPPSLNVVNLVTVFLEKFEAALADQRDGARNDTEKGIDNIVVEGNICTR